MSVRRVRGIGIVCILSGGEYKPGDPPPTGYLQWHEWAEVQHKAGLRQKQCGCGKWCYPQELSTIVNKTTYPATGRRGKGPPITLTTPVCLKCARASTAT